MMKPIRDSLASALDRGNHLASAENSQDKSSNQSLRVSQSILSSHFCFWNAIDDKGPAASPFLVESVTDVCSLFQKNP